MSRVSCFVTQGVLFFLVCAQIAPLDRSSRFMAQTTWLRVVRICSV